MTDIVLPKLSQTGPNEWADAEDNDVAIRDVINGQLDNDNLSGAAGITRANLATESKPLRWYTPKIIPTEESRTNVAYGTLATPDEVKEVVLPANGLMVVLYMARFRSSVEAAGRAALFLNAAQLRAGNSVLDETPTIGTGTFHLLYTQELAGLQTGEGISGEALPTTGHAASSMPVFADAGTYDISVKFKATSGSVTAKERKLWIGVLG